jgi:hypothetical protein
MIINQTHLRDILLRSREYILKINHDADRAHDQTLDISQYEIVCDTEELISMIDDILKSNEETHEPKPKRNK